MHNPIHLNTIQYQINHIKFLFQLSGGLDFSTLQGYNIGYGFQLNGGYYFNTVLGIRADIQADFINRGIQTSYNPDGMKEKVTGRDMKLFTFKVDILYGNFDINSFINTYILVGAGFREKNYSTRTFEQTYFSYFTNSDTTKKTVNEAYWKTDFSAGVGAGLNLKLSPKVRISGEFQYMLLEGLSNNDEILNGSNALFKVGVSFMFK